MTEQSAHQGKSTAGKAASGGGRWFKIISTVLIVFLSVDLVFLVIKNRRYEEMLMQSGVIQRDDAMKPGDRIGDIAITTLEGKDGQLSVSTPNDRYLLFVLSTSCPHCLANLPKWADINRRVAPSGRYVVGLSVHGAKETVQYIQDNGVAFYTVTTPDTAFLDRYRIPGVPATLLLSTGGVVQNVWIGELTDDQVADVINQAL
jgi:peroxiredoxin